MGGKVSFSFRSEIMIDYNKNFCFSIKYFTIFSQNLRRRVVIQFNSTKQICVFFQTKQNWSSTFDSYAYANIKKLWFNYLLPLIQMIES